MSSNPICPPYIQVNGKLLPRRFVHEAGHAVITAVTSDDPVRIDDGAAVTDEGMPAGAICTSDWKLGPNEMPRELFLRRIASIYAAVMAEAICECPGDFENESEKLWYENEAARGDQCKIDRICREEMPDSNIMEEDRQTIRAEAWRLAGGLVKLHSQEIKEVAKELHRKGSLSNVEIRRIVIDKKEEMA
jgi:hypothetical protein